MTDDRRGEGAMRRSGSEGRDRPINVHDLERAASVIVGAGFALYALKGLSLRRAPAAVLGAALVHRGVTGYCPTYQALGVNTASNDENAAPIEIEQSVTVRRDAGELYRLWREQGTLNRVMAPSAEVNPKEGGETEWTLRLPLDQSVRYVTRVTEEREAEFMRWESAGEGAPKMSGTLRLAPAPADWGTEVRLTLSLEAPGGSLGRALAQALGPVPKLFAQKALRRFKSLAETGEIPTLHHNPAARQGGRDE